MVWKISPLSLKAGFIGLLFVIGGCPQQPTDTENPDVNIDTGNPDGNGDPANLLPDSVLTLPSAAGGYATRDIGSLGGTTTVLAISSSGAASGFGLDATSATRAFFFNRVSIKNLGVVGSGNSSRAFALNDAARIVGDSAGDSRVGARFEGSTTSDVPGLPGGETTIYGVNEAGLMVGSSRSAEGQMRAVLIGSDGAVSDLGPGTAYGIGDGGSIVGSDGEHAFLIRSPGESPQDLGTLGGNASAALAVNAPGIIVGSAENAAGEVRAFVYANNAMFELGVLPEGRTSSALAINETNQIVGTATNAAGNSRAVMFQNGAVIDLNSRLNPRDQQRYTLINATGINASGKICCNTAQGKALILTPQRGADFLRYQLRDLNVPRSSGLDSTCTMTPEGAPHVQGTQTFTGRVAPDTYALAKSGRILLSGQLLAIDFEKRTTSTPYYFSQLSYPLPPPPDGGLTRWGNTVQYDRTFVYEAGEFRDVGVPSGTQHDFQPWQTNSLYYASPAPYLSFKATLISPNGDFLWGTSWKDTILSIDYRADFYGILSEIDSSFYPPGTDRTFKDAQFVFHGGFSERADRHEQVAAINDVGQTCGHVRRLGSDPANIPVGASIDGKIIGPGACVAINNSGQAVGGTGATAFVYANGTVTQLDLGGGPGTAYDLNNFGDVVGESTTPSGEVHAFLYSEGKTVDLGVIEGGTYSSARYINDAGEIVGYAKDAQGVQKIVVFRDGKAIDIVSRIADEADRAIAPFAALHGLDEEGNVLVSKPYNRFDNNVFLLERLQ